MPLADLIDLDAIASRGRSRDAQPEAQGRAQRRPAMTTAMFARQIEERARGEMQRRMSHACGTLNPSEVEALIQRAADMKSRYFAALLDAGSARGIPQKDQFEELAALRAWSEELEAGLLCLKESIARGEVRVEGVAAEGL